MKNIDRLNIAFWIWAPFDNGEGGEYHDFGKCFKEAKERGFNCVRVEDGAGFFRTVKGEVREQKMLHPVFGKFTKYIRQNFLVEPALYDPRKRLVELFKAADEYDMTVILSSWYYLHTNWFVDEEMNQELFDLSFPEKMAYFARELDEILSILRENRLLHRVAFAELFNEFDGIVDNFGLVGQDDEIRKLHEDTLAWLKARHPDVKFAYDMTCDRNSLVPRNADVINRHNYYMWDVYRCFEEGQVGTTDTPITLSEHQKEFLLPCPVTVEEVNTARGENLRTGSGWSQRVALYASIDPEKVPALDAMLEESLQERKDEFLQGLRESMTKIRDFRDEFMPEAELVMGEGVTYCAANCIDFEEHSDLYWETVEEGLKILKELGFNGAVVRTTSGPEDPYWGECRERYAHANGVFSAD